MGVGYKGLQSYILLILICLLFYLPGLTTLPPTDRDESRFAQATSQMLESHDFVRIRFQDEPRNKKPVGIHWLQSAAVALTGTLEERTIWPYRLPSLFGGIAAVLLTFAWARKVVDESTAFLAAALCAGSIMLVAEAHLATTDAVLLALLVAAQGALSRYYLRPDPNVPAGVGPFLTFWIALAFGILIKGPILPLVILLTVGALIATERNIRWLKGLRPLSGLVIAAAIVLPWAIAVLQAQDSYFQEAIGKDLLSKVASGQESHGFPPGWYLLLAPLTLWPASFFVAPATVRAWKSRSVPLVKFCLAWIIPTWIVFELIPTKLPHYLLPTYPALCLLGAEALTACVAGKATELSSKWMRIASIPCSLIILGLVFGACALPYVLEGRFDAVALLPVVFSCLATGLFMRDFWKGRYYRAAMISIIGTGLALAPFFQWVLPKMSTVWMSRGVAVEARQYAQKHGVDLKLASAGYHEPSLVFTLGTRTLLTSSSEAALFLRNNPTGLALISSGEDEEFRREAKRLNLAAAEVGVVSGFNYSNGKNMVLRLYGINADGISAQTGTQAE